MDCFEIATQMNMVSHGMDSNGRYSRPRVVEATEREVSTLREVQEPVKSAIASPLAVRLISLVGACSQLNDQNRAGGQPMLRSTSAYTYIIDMTLNRMQGSPRPMLV